MANILVYVELVEDSASWASLLTLRQARYLATNVGATIYAVLPCAKPPLYGENDIIAILSRQGADKVILMTHGELTLPTLFSSHGEALLTAANQFPPAMLLIPEGPAAVEIAPRVAARLGGLFVRHPELTVQDGGGLRIDQPLFEDSHVCRFDSVQLEHSVVAVVAPDPQQFAQPLGTEEAEVVVISPGFAEEAAPRQPILSAETLPGGRPQRMVLVGAGIDTAEEVEAIRELATLVKAQLRVTENAATKGLLDNVPLLEAAPLVCPPELILAFGVQGSADTLARLVKSTYLVAVNTDEKAPLFQRAQLGLVAPALETAQQMVADAKGRGDEPLLPVPPEEPEPQADEDEEADSESTDDADGKEGDALRDTLPPETLAAAAPTQEMAVALDDTVPSPLASMSALGKLPTDPVLTALKRPVDQLAHTPPMGTPLTTELKKALLAAGAPTAEEASVADENTPEASPAGVVDQPNDPALDDTVPAPLPGAEGKPPTDAPAGDDPNDAEKSDEDKSDDPGDDGKEPPA